ncbi:uncharacterized protein [Diabrotica undecimpunctata]|uniref:uncharacterized protein n=1 Tax=Diabrotica undecimpunctata TaxID=50387 RepID=UPI003B63CB2E
MKLIDEVFLRFSLPRRSISDNGLQFVSAVMQQVCFLLQIKENFTSIYHPFAKMVERKNRDLKRRLAMLVGTEHNIWPEKIPIVRFAVNSVSCESTRQTAAYLTFGRELQTLDQVNQDIRQVVKTENFMAKRYLYLKRMADGMAWHDKDQDRKILVYADRRLKEPSSFKKKRFSIGQNNCS